MKKDIKIIKNWLLEADKRARKKGFKRYYKFENLVDETLKENYMFSTSKEEKKQVIDCWTDQLVALEKICDFMDKNHIYPRQLRIADKIIVW